MICFNTLFKNLVIGVLLLMLAAACTQPHRYRIGVSQCSSDDWRSKMNAEIQREAMVHEDVEVEIRSANDDNAKQIADIKYFADNNFDIIIAAPNEAKAITPAIRDAYNKGIPVIVFDRDIAGDTYTARIRTDNTAIGRDAAKYAFSLYPPGHPLKAIEIYGLEGSTPAIERHNGFANAIKSGGGTLLGSGHGNWNKENAEHVADSLLRLYPDADVIYAHNDRMAIGASEVAKKMGLNNIRVIGIDAAPNIGIKAVRDSVIDATFLYPTEGHLVIKEALKILHGEPFPRDTVLPVSSAVDLSNADILLVQNNSLEQETAKMTELKTRIDQYWEKHSAQTSFFHACIAILILVILILFILLRAYWQRKRHQEILLDKNRQLQLKSEEQRELNSKLEELMKSKLTFYTHVSHDLRTPLTLIADPVSQLSKADNLTPQQHTLASMADKNVKILKRLINQILDFRKYESGKLALNLTEVDLKAAIREWVGSFKTLAMQHDIKLSIDEDPNEVCVAVDTEKLERIFFNILANAIKHTPDNGSISVSYRLEKGHIVIRFKDTGCGIPQESIDSIFKQFYQADNLNHNGSGIGLALVKAFVDVFKGTISVESMVGQGTTFTVTLPEMHTDGKCAVPQKLITDEEVTSELGNLVRQPEDPGNDKPRVLVIDDNEDIRVLVGQLLGDKYEVTEASDGREGLAKAARLVPDLVICDRMMPVMDGLECCRRIKEEVSTSHIPVLMLTACAMDHQRAEGYESGADGYLSKPFSAEVLRTRCDNLILNRKRIKELWLSEPANASPLPKKEAQGEAKPANKPTVSDIDNEFYHRFLEIFQKEMSNSELNIDDIASKMGLGHSQFYRKIKALTNYTPVELIRNLRLKEARRLLLTSQKSVSEIAYEVGFSSPAYFTKCYRTAFGQTPSELRDSLALNQS